MREKVFAWYPQASDVLKSRREGELDSYTKECLYRYGKSRYCDKDVDERAAAAENDKQSKDALSVTQLDEMTSKTAKVSLRPHPPSFPFATRSRSAAVEMRGRETSCKPGCSFQPFASKEWHGRLAATSTSLGLNIEGEGEGPRGIPSPEVQAERARVQSAIVRRPGIPVVRRSIQSALPQTRQPRSATLTDSEPHDAIIEKETNDRRGISRPQAPTPLRWTEEKGQPEEERFGMKSSPLDYDDQLKKYGWKMEIPGDPLRIKRSCIRRRLETTIVVPMRAVHQRPQSCQAQSSETFFYNTIPRMPMSFTIHPDWTSEILQARRIDLKENKAKTTITSGFCRQADFSFIY